MTTVLEISCNDAVEVRRERGQEDALDVFAHQKRRVLVEELASLEKEEREECVFESYKRALNVLTS